MNAIVSRTLILALGFAFAFGCKKSNSAQTEKEEPSGAALSKAPSKAEPTAKPKPKPPPTRPEKPLNVLLLSIDSLRADMPWTGYDRAIAPNLTKLAEEGIIYENARSISSYTAQSVATFLSGRYASTLYREGYFFTTYPKSNEFFPEALQKAGISTFGVHAHMYFHRGKGLSQGFDKWELTPGISFDSETDNHVTSEKSTKLILEMLDERDKDKQFFLWAHYMDPHDQYHRHEMCPEEWGRKNRDRYDCEVLFTDLWLGKLFDYVRKQGIWDDTAIIITADHGEAFGEHGMYKHAFELWDVLTRVPLIFKVPGAQPRRIAEARTHIDLAPTIMDLMGQPPLSGFMGESLVPEMFGKEPKARDVIVLELAEDSHNPARRAIVKGDYKLIVFGLNQGYKRLLFNIKKDPEEEHDLSEAEPEKLKEMRELFQQTFDEIPSIKPYGGIKLRNGTLANGPAGPPKK